MLLDLTRYRQPLGRFARTFQPLEVGDEVDAYRVVSPVELAFDIHKDREKFRLIGAVRGQLELGCSRCLEPFSLDVDAPFDLRYLPASAMSSDPEREVLDEDLDLSYYRDDHIDLNELLREQFYLALPMKPLCREDCRGLCPQCGANLNTAACACANTWEDPRLASLKAFTPSDRSDRSDRSDQ
jgi:uncharacterized protein